MTELEKKLENTYKRIAILVSIIALILAIPIFFINKNFILIYFLCWYIALIIILLNIIKIDDLFLKIKDKFFK